MRAAILQIFSIFVCAVSASAQLSIPQPNSSNVKIASPPDYATDVLLNAWDMDDADDIASFIPSADTGSGLTSVNIANGMLNFNIASADSAYFHLLSPGQCSTNPLGKNGQAFPIDSTKYRYLTIRMSMTAGSEMRFLWYRGCSYASDWVRTVATPTKTGWHTYTVDLQSIAHESNSGGDSAWNAQPITGLRIEPGYSGAVTMDWIRLSGTPPNGSTYQPSYTFSASGADTRHSIFLDDDASPFNGYVEALITDAASASAVTVSSNYLHPDSYRLAGVASDDFATLRANPWDMQGSEDVSESNGISSATFSGGVYSGAASGDPYFFLNLFGTTINSSVYRYLCFRMNSTYGGQTFVVWYDSNGNPSLGFYTAQAGDATYSLDLQNIATSGAAWTSNSWSKLRIGLPAGGSPNNFSVQWVALRQNGCSSSDTAPTPTLSPGSVIANSAPAFRILQPDNRGGADFASTVLSDPWNFDSASDIKSYTHLSVSEIYPNNSIDGLQGDFFHAKNTDGSDDPYHPNLEEASTSSLKIDTSRFKNLVYKLYIAREQDVVSGSVARFIWQAAADGDASPFNGDDQITFDGWNEYVQDMTKVELEPAIHAPGTFIDPPWHGNVNYFRIDPHEFSTETEYFFDYIRITADDEANSQFAITYELEDADDDADDVSVSLYYSTSASLTNPQPIVLNLPMSRNSRVYLWDTSALAAGIYYVFGVASDGVNEFTHAATGRLVKTSLPQDTTAPSLIVDSPTNGKTIYDDMIVKGYAIDNIQTANVEVLADGELLATFRPSRFNKLARNSYSTYAEASNAGFFETIDASSLSTGAHSIIVNVYDTAGNLTSSGSINVTKAAGNDPALESEPAAENESPVTIAPAVHNLGLRFRLDAKKNTLAVRVTGGANCSEIKVVAGPKKAVVANTPEQATVILTSGGEETVSQTVKKLKGLKKKKSKDVSVYAAALCNGSRKSAVIKAVPTTLSNRKKVKTIASWISHVQSKF